MSADHHGFLQYAAITSSEDFLGIYADKGLLHEYTVQQLKHLGELGPVDVTPNLLNGFSIQSNPSLEWVLERNNEHYSLPAPAELVVGYGFANLAAAAEFRELIDAGTKPGPFGRIGANVGGSEAANWCPGTGDSATFGNRADAHEQLRAHVLAEGGFTGEGVNVVIFDRGINEAYIPPNNWGGRILKLGSAPDPERTSHGNMVARNVLALAPQATIWDVTVIPERIIDVVPYADLMHAVTTIVIVLIEGGLAATDKWVFVNAWAIFDRRREYPLGDYTENLRCDGHPLNEIMNTVVQTHNIDVVFAAGNCGAYCPSLRCGPTDRGRGASIWGANSHPDVITAGAVRVDDMWLGDSSQGPGQMLLDPMKPDVCAPSQFAETLDPHVHNTGTSAACAMTAGVVAALRSQRDHAALSPGALKQELIRIARKTESGGWDHELGHGILSLDGLTLPDP